MAESEKMVTVTVAPRRSIHTRVARGMPLRVHGPGSQVEVAEKECERLLKQGFIVDPSAKKLTQAEIDSADLSHALPGAGVKVTEDAAQSVRPANKGTARTAA